jgi:hypothetical protein
VGERKRSKAPRNGTRPTRHVGDRAWARGRRGKGRCPCRAQRRGRCVRTTARPWPSTAASFGRFPRSWAPPQTHAGTATPRDAKKRSKRTRRFGHRPKHNRAHTREKAGTVRDPNGRSRLFESQERQKLETQTVKGGIDNYHARSMPASAHARWKRLATAPSAALARPQRYHDRTVRPPVAPSNRRRLNSARLRKLEGWLSSAFTHLGLAHEVAHLVAAEF